MRTRFCLLFVALIATMSVFAYDFEYGNLCYNITSDSTAEVTYQKSNLSDNYSGLTSAIIPESVTYDGTTYRVARIEGTAFQYCTGLTSVIIPNSVTSIGAWAFVGCRGLTSVTIPNSVTSIERGAFESCSFLETVTFGSGLQNVEVQAFDGCQNIYKMTIYATKVPNVSSENVFYGVSKLAELHVPAESVKKYKIHPVWGLFNVITAIPYTVTLLCDNVQGAVVGSGSYQPNEQVTITAKPNAGYRFVQWSDGITTNPRMIVVASDTTLTAEFEEIPASEYTVSVVVDPAQHGTVQMTLTAVPDEGYQFTRWSDGNTENPRTILVTENMTLSATFNLSTKASNASAEESQDGTRKVFRNGQMYIIRGEKTYTATGSQL